MSSNLIPNISVDCVIFGFDAYRLNVLLVERSIPGTGADKPLMKDYTLAGHHVYEDENLKDAAARILYGLSGLHGIYLEQLGAFGQKDRARKPHDKLWRDQFYQNLSERVVTVAYFALLDSQTIKLEHKERNVAWFPVNELPGLGYDHRDIILSARKELKRKVLLEPIIFELLPDKFTMTQLQTLYEAILNIKFDRRNFRRKVLKMKHIIPLDEKQKDVQHKPAQLYIFSRDVYDKLYAERLFLKI